MPDAGMIQQQVASRIAELEKILGPLQAELDQLKAVAASFGAVLTATPPPARARRRAGRAAAASVGVGAGADGSRSEQALELIAAQPGVTAAELAVAIGISRNYLYRVLPKLEKRGVVKKRGTGYELGDTPAGG